jgi:hypothetical protein
LAWNKNTVEDQLILDDIKTISNGKINTEGITLNYIAPVKKNRGHHHHHKKNNRRKHKK